MASSSAPPVSARRFLATALTVALPGFIVLAGLVVGSFLAPLAAVVAGAVTGGGLTVIANAPNPAGQAILNRHFQGGVAPGGLLAAALLPTLILFLTFMLIR